MCTVHVDLLHIYIDCSVLWPPLCGNVCDVGEISKQYLITLYIFLHITTQ